MPRIRSIKPQFWLDENLGGISRDARLLYIGLWNLSDDQGVFEWRTAKIKIQLFPYDADITNGQIEEWLNFLTNTKDIAKFEYDGHSFGYIKSFLEHQEIKKPSKWIFAPVPDELKNSPPLVGKESPTNTPLEGEKLESGSPAVPLGSRGEGKRSRFKGKGVGKKGEVGDRGVGEGDTTTSATSLDFFLKKFSYAFGREPDSRERAFLRDLALEVSRAGVTDQQVHDAFAEAARHNKMNVSYVRAVLLDWLGVPR